MPPARVWTAAPTLKCEYGAMAWSRAARAAATSASKSLKRALQKRHELAAHARRRLDDFLFGERLRQNAGGHVRDARDAKHLDPHVASDDGFGRRRHAD